MKFEGFFPAVEKDAKTKGEETVNINVILPKKMLSVLRFCLLTTSANI